MEGKVGEVFLTKPDFRSKFCDKNCNEKRSVFWRGNDLFFTSFWNAFSLILFVKQRRPASLYIQFREFIRFRRPQWGFESWTDPGWQRWFGLGRRLVRWGRGVRRRLHHSQTPANLGRKWRRIQKSSIKVFHDLFLSFLLPYEVILDKIINFTIHNFFHDLKRVLSSYDHENITNRQF